MKLISGFDLKDGDLFKISPSSDCVYVVYGTSRGYLFGMRKDASFGKEFRAQFNRSNKYYLL